MEKRLDATNVIMNYLELLTTIGNFLVAIVAIFYPIINRLIGIFKAKNSLKYEMLYNINQMYTTEVERPLLFYCYDNFKINFLTSIKNIENFEKIEQIYSQFRYYDKYITSFYINGVYPGKYATEKQVQSYNNFFNLFKLDIHPYSIEKLNSEEGSKYIDNLRNEMIKKYKFNYNDIRLEIDLIFKNL